MALGVPVALLIARTRFKRLRRVNARPVGLVSPGLTPVMLMEDGWNRGDLTEVSLSYGRLLDVATPYAMVTTYLFGDDDIPPIGADITRRKGQDAAIRHQRWEEIEGDYKYPDDELKASQMMGSLTQSRDVIVGDEHLTVLVTAHAHYEAFRVQHGGAAVRFVGRHLQADTIRLETVSDLEPYFRGYVKFMLDLLTWNPVTTM